MAKTNFDKAVEIIVNDLRSDIDGLYADWEISNWAEMLDAFGADSADMKDDIQYTLIEAAKDKIIPWCFNDDLSIEESDGQIRSYRQLTNAVRKQLF